jgi:hypothetical protein
MPGQAELSMAGSPFAGSEMSPHRQHRRHVSVAAVASTEAKAGRTFFLPKFNQKK